jgi:hypothetical protein
MFTGMDDLTVSKLTSRDRWGLAVLAIIVWAGGAALDGASTVAIVVAPLFVVLYLCIVVAVDRWVRRGIDQLKPLARCPAARQIGRLPESDGPT